ncbi:MAG: leucine-rich repeat domain-containing protein [Atopobiaceae bacterium]|nr:leucine-rich repeat domain-containing protein [Atopobiaceae bacterium]
MELWNLIVSFCANVPLYDQTNRNLFLVTLGIVLVFSAINFYSYIKAAAGLQNPIAKVGYLLVTLIGVLALVAAGFAFVSAQEVAELRPEVLTQPLFFQLAIAGALDAGIFLIAICRRGDDMESVEAEEVLKSLAKAVFVVVYSLIGAFVGNGISSWGFRLFGRTLGTWVFGAYLAWAMRAAFGVVGFVVQGPLVLLFGNPDAKVEDFLETSIDGIFDEFEDKPRGQRDWRKVIILALIGVALVVGLSFARNVFQEVAVVPEAPAVAASAAEEPAGQPEEAAPESEPEAEPEAPAPETATGPRKGRPADHVMDWGDPVLESYMREITGITEGDIWLHDVWLLTDLDLSVQPDEDNVIREGPRITDISALAELTNLQTLHLTFQDVEDISAVANMPDLYGLDIQSCRVSDLTPLAGLDQLEWLLAGYCRITDLSPLAGMTSLQSLSLYYNRVTDIEPLRGLTNLEYLNLQCNPIEDYSPIEGLDIEELFV